MLRAPRRRDGATFWRIYRDLADPSRYVERFIVTSWADYLHQRARATLADQELEARVRRFVQAGRGGDDAALHRRALRVHRQQYALGIRDELTSIAREGEVPSSLFF